MKKILIYLFIVIFLATFGYIGFTSYKNNKKENEAVKKEMIKGEQKNQPVKAPQPEPEVDESAEVKKTVVDFFQKLKDEKYSEASKMLGIPEKAIAECDKEESDSFECINISWEGLAGEGNISDYSKVLQNYCEGEGVCLEAKVTNVINKKNDKYLATVQFIKEDGSIYSEQTEDDNSKELFEYKVIKEKGEFKLLNLIP